MASALRSTLRAALRHSAAARRPLPTQAQYSRSLSQATGLSTGQLLRHAMTAQRHFQAGRSPTAAAAHLVRNFSSLPAPVMRAVSPFMNAAGALPRLGFVPTSARDARLGQRRMLAYARRSINELLRRTEAEANAKPYDSHAQAEYLSLLNEAGLHSEVMRRAQSGKFAAGGRVQEEVKRAMAAHPMAAHSPMNPSPLAAMQSNGGSMEEPLHVVIAGRASPFTVFMRAVSVGLTLLICFFLFQTLNNTSGARNPFEALSGGFSDEATEVPDVRFDDVKGVDEAKEELEQLVDYLKNPEKYTKLGGKIPKGVLLTGPPGTGKTLLARAIAGEAEVPFFSRSASEFEEMLVGLGASRVRKLFDAAKEAAPCIVFIDEIDAIGGKRMKVSTVAHDRQTLNQLLSSMDGFVKSDGVIVLAATNFPESLDAALTRPGRFDVSVAVPLPDVRGRTEILELYLSKVVTDDTISAETLARATPGMSGADLETLVNQAALRAAKRNSLYISLEDIDEAKDKLMLGPARRNKVVKPETLRKTAYHEGGHTLVALLTKDAMPIYKTTILPRGQTAGVTYFLPEYRDEGNLTRSQIMAQLDVAMGGRVAEELIFGPDEVTTGAGSDMQQASSMARRFVMQFSMSRLGLTTYDRNTPPSPEMQAVIDREVSKLLDESYKRATELLKSNRAQLDRLAAALLKHETLSLDEMKLAIRGRRLPTEEQKRQERARAHKKKAATASGGAATDNSDAASSSSSSGRSWFSWPSSSAAKPAKPAKPAAEAPKTIGPAPKPATADAKQSAPKPGKDTQRWV